MCRLDSLYLLPIRSHRSCRCTEHSLAPRPATRRAHFVIQQAMPSSFRELAERSCDIGVPQQALGSHDDERQGIDGQQACLHAQQVKVLGRGPWQLAMRTLVPAASCRKRSSRALE